jgi:5-oxoprolinase (ATP-hydrolysing)
MEMFSLFSVGKSHDALGDSVFVESDRLTFAPVPSSRQKTTSSVYYPDTGRVDVGVFLLEDLVPGDLIKGPAIIVDGTQTLVLDSRSEGKITSKHVFIELL